MPTDLLSAIRDRGEKQTSFEYGISTADRYVQNLVDVVGLDVAYPMASKGNTSLSDCLQKAKSTLVYGNEDMGVIEKGSIPKDIKLPKDALIVFKHVLTTPKIDRDGDVLKTEGAIIDPRMPLLWQHVHTLPIGKMLGVVEHNEKRLVLLSCIIDFKNDVSHDAAVMVENDMARFSHGFRALEWTERKETEGEVTGPLGYEIKKFEIMEASVVSVPSNTDAEMGEVLVDLVEQGKLTSGYMKQASKQIRDKMPLIVQSGIDLKTAAHIQEDENEDIDNTKQQGKSDDAESAPEQKATVQKDHKGFETKTIKAGMHQITHVQPRETKRFDPEMEHLEATKLEYEWASRWIGCQVKELQVASTFVPRFRKGSFLSGLRVVTKDWNERDVRNLAGSFEEPPFYEVIDLNSKLTDTFLVRGIRFLTDDQGNRVCIKYSAGWGGINIVTYEKHGQSIGEQTISKAWDWAFENNFLKGEAFRISGGFLKRGDTAWDDVFLKDENKAPMQKISKTINAKGWAAPNRGLIAMGPPGTGKTLSGRVLLNETKASFIWVAAKDMYDMGAIEAICSAFSLAKELGPTIIFMEDIDNYMSEYAIDILKTEMDGIEKTNGIATILTTNYPERFPDALIDRPGRFHDVCLFNLPDTKTRTEMLQKWTGEQNIKNLKTLLEETEGLSGAHMYELVSYAKTLQEDDEQLDICDAMEKAITKIKDQRQLIDQQQLAGSAFGSRRSNDVPTKKSIDSGAIDEKKGRKLNSQYVKAIQDCVDDLKACLDTDKDMTRGTQAICERVVGRLEKMLASAEEDNGDDDKPKTVDPKITVKGAMALILAEASVSDRGVLLKALQAMEELAAKEKLVNQVKAFLG